MLSREALGMLLEYSWPGNVREVSNVIERLIVVTPDNVIFPHHLPLELCDGSRYESINSGLSLKEHLEKVELLLIQSAVKRHGSARKAAPYLGVDASTITRKLRRMNGRS